MKKIAFFDIDGTLIHLETGLLRPSQATVSALRQFQAEGNLLIVATARGSIPKALDDISFDGCILSDGQYIEFNGDVIYDQYFSSTDFSFLIDLFKHYTDSIVFGGVHGKWVSNHHSPLILELERTFGDLTTFEHVPLISNQSTIKANSCTPLFTTIDHLLACRNELPSSWAVNTYDHGLLRMDIHLPGFSKGSACVHLVDYLNLSLDNAFAFGDGINDIEMLKLIPNSVAMGNASETVKQTASFITDSVDEEGIANYLKKLDGIV